MNNAQIDLNKLRQKISEKYGEICVIEIDKCWNPSWENDFSKNLSDIFRKYEYQKSFNITKNNNHIPKNIYNRNKDFINNNICNMCKKYSFKNSDNVFLLKHQLCEYCYIIESEKNKEEK